MGELKPLLMIVDDSPLNIKTLEAIFRAHYRIVPRKSGEQVLQYFETLGFIFDSAPGPPLNEGEEDAARISDLRVPDLILLDVMMPGLSGFDVCSKLKTNPRLAMIPIIFVTGKTDAESVTKGFGVGAVDYVTKPFNAAELNARVSTHMLLRDTLETLMEKNVLLGQKMQEIAEQAEKMRQKDAQLVMMDRIAGLGTLASGIAHEVNTPLGFLKSTVNGLKADCDKMVQAVSELARTKVGDPVPNDSAACISVCDLSGFQDCLDRKFSRLDRGIERISQIVNSLRRLSRIDREGQGTLDINAVIDDIIELLSSQDKPIRFEKKYGHIPALECVPKEINQCLLHLLKNAVDAVKFDGAIVIETFLDQDQKNLCVRISDNGAGMSAEVLRQAFNPFFTTKPVGSGTGVGLTIAEQIVVNHQGHIELISNEGSGTTVLVCLPLPSACFAHDTLQ